MAFSLVETALTLVLAWVVATRLYRCLSLEYLYAGKSGIATAPHLNVDGCAISPPFNSNVDKCAASPRSNVDDYAARPSRDVDERATLARPRSNVAEYALALDIATRVYNHIAPLAYNTNIELDTLQLYFVNEYLGAARRLLKLSRHPLAASDVSLQSLIIPEVFGRLSLIPPSLLLSQRAFVCWDLVLDNSCKVLVKYVPLVSLWYLHRPVDQPITKQRQALSSYATGALDCPARTRRISENCLDLESDEDSLLQATEALVDSQSEAISSSDSVEPIFTTPYGTGLANRGAIPLCITTFTPTLIDVASPCPRICPPHLSDRPPVTAGVPSTNTAPVKRLKAASVELVLFLAWKVISQTRVVSRPRRRLRPSRDFLQHVVCQHVKSNAMSGALSQSRGTVIRRAMLDEVSVTAALAPARPPKEPESEKVASPVVKPPVTAPASPFDCEPRRNQLLRSSTHASIRGKLLYGARKSVRSKPLRAPRLQPVPPSGENDPLSSNAATETVSLDLRFSKLGDYVSERRRNAFPLRMLVAASTRFSTPAA